MNFLESLVMKFAPAEHLVRKLQAEKQKVEEELATAKLLVEHQLDVIKKFEDFAASATELYHASQALMAENKSLKDLLAGKKPEAGEGPN